MVINFGDSEKPWQRSARHFLQLILDVTS